ncbi:MAG: nuclear transport factor 2 family protein [Acidobacteria bacterium]|nr:nuclear transport factor 2 family protein [Acidobacteriota bacterium]
MSTQELDQALNRQILSGDIMGAFDKYYADDIVMQENSSDPTVGKAANRERELQFVNSITEFHGAAVVSSAVNGDTSFGEWEMDVTFQGGQRYKLAQASVRTWENGQIVRERFYYSKG